jgi:hypothetical protein
MRANIQSVRFLVCILLLMTGVCHNALANPFPWVNNNKLWWNTDPNTPLSIEQDSLVGRHKSTFGGARRIAGALVVRS